jgi:hypothetical protein
MRVCARTPPARARAAGQASVCVSAAGVVARIWLLTVRQDKTRTTLTMDDLSAALGEYGVNARKPDYYM